jgi:hypothetical protein
LIKNHEVTNYNLSRPPLLVWLGLVYLFIPVFCFAWYWFIGVVAVPVLVLGTASMICLCNFRDFVTVRLNKVVKTFPTLAIAAIWVWTSGIWGFGFARTNDWKIARDDYLSALTTLDWPIVHQFANGGPFAYFRHYLAFYLPGPLITKILDMGTDSTLLFTGVWMWLGVVIVMLLLWKFTSANGQGLLIPNLVFIFFSGFDILGSRLKGTSGLTPQSFLNAGHIEWWSKQFQFSSMTTALHWVPQHAIAGWVGAMIILNLRHPKLFLIVTPLVLSATLLWSPFVSVGLLLVAIAVWNPLWCMKRIRFQTQDIICIAFAILSGTLVAGFLISGSSGLPRSLLYTNETYSRGGYSNDAGLQNTLLNLLLFLMIEVVPFVALVVLWNKARRRMVLLTGVLLIACTQFVMSYDSLFTMRASIPLLAILAALTAETLQMQLRKGLLQSGTFVAVLLLCIGSITSIIEFVARADSTESASQHLQTPCLISGCMSDMTNPSKFVFDWSTKVPWYMKNP